MGTGAPELQLALRCEESVVRVAPRGQEPRACRPVTREIRAQRQVAGALHHGHERCGGLDVVARVRVWAAHVRDLVDGRATPAPLAVAGQC